MKWKKQAENGWVESIGQASTKDLLCSLWKIWCYNKYEMMGWALWYNRLSHHLQYLHPISEHHFQHFKSQLANESPIPAKAPRRQQIMASTCIPVTHIGNQDGVPGCWVSAWPSSSYWNHSMSEPLGQKSFSHSFQSCLPVNPETKPFWNESLRLKCIAMTVSLVCPFVCSYRVCPSA